MSLIIFPFNQLKIAKLKWIIDIMLIKIIYNFDIQWIKYMLYLIVVIVWITFGLDRTFMAFGSTTTIGRRWEIVMTINV